MSAPTSGTPNTEVKVGYQEMALLSNILAAYTFIADQPEKTALVFLGSVCVGLLLTLCAIVFQIHCRADCHFGNSPGPTGDSESEDWDETSDLSARRRRRFERALLNATMFTSAEDLDRTQRLEERERILREIWMNGQPDISTVTQSLNRYY
ncbi:Protein eva-1 like A [Dissostichus eleginoides]|uniref:Protein eva-1 like A n=1 Tax=Dissostichus eleginoides TaxID=100907 RepID=A0AAD9F833_DISEL|nr:Protein eva-1 like A [Dissostichus eleginoides]